MKRLIYLLLCFIASIGWVSAQTTRITGTAVSAEDGEPIIGASVMVVGTTMGNVTDINGAFSLNVPYNARRNGGDMEPQCLGRPDADVQQ
jgi:hypothetical protein